MLCLSFLRTQGLKSFTLHAQLSTDLKITHKIPQHWGLLFSLHDVFSDSSSSIGHLVPLPSVALDMSHFKPRQEALSLSSPDILELLAVLSLRFPLINSVSLDFCYTLFIFPSGCLFSVIRSFSMYLFPCVYAQYSLFYSSILHY